MFMSFPSVNEIPTKANPVVVKDGTNIHFYTCLQPNNEKKFRHWWARYKRSYNEL